MGRWGVALSSGVAAWYVHATWPDVVAWAINGYGGRLRWRVVPYDVLLETKTVETWMLLEWLLAVSSCVLSLAIAITVSSVDQKKERIKERINASCHSRDS